MLSPSRPRLRDAFAFVASGVALLTLAALSAEARLNVQLAQFPASANYIYGSPIPTPVPVNPATGRSSRSQTDFQRDHELVTPRHRRRVVMHGNDSGSERGMVVVDQVPNRAEMITQLFGKRK